MRNIIRELFTETKNDEQREESQLDDPPRPFIEHFIDLRNSLIGMAIAWVASLIVIIPFAPTISTILQEPLQSAGLTEQGITVQSLELLGGIKVFMQVVLWGGTTLSLPFLIYFIFRFIFPGLKRHERNLILFTLSTGVILFTLGVWMCFSFTLDIGFQVLMQLNEWMKIDVTILQADAYIAIVLKTILAFGLAFQLPLILLVLGWLGVISSTTLREKRGISIILIFVIAMFLTPPEPVSQIIMALPMCLLYEVCIWLIRMKECLNSSAGDYE